METNTNEENYYHPSDIFNDNTNPQGMTGEANLSLAISFYHSRYDDEGKFNNRFGRRETDFSRNAGAIQLYYKEHQDIVFPIPGFETNEYNFVSIGGLGGGTYGHTERELMKLVLDDLMISAQDGGDLRHPSDPGNFPNVDDFEELHEEEKLGHILRRLTHEAEEYKNYLVRKNVIVKMWTERPPCNFSGYDGRGCDEFIDNIFPEGSQYGYFVKNYRTKQDWKVEVSSKELKKAYFEFVGRQGQGLPVGP